MKGSLLAFAIVGALDLDSPSIPAGLKWDEWKSIFGKSYSTEDGEAIAYKKFQATDTKINAHNAKGDTWMMGHNQRIRCCVQLRECGGRCCSGICGVT